MFYMLNKDMVLLSFRWEDQVPEIVDKFGTVPDFILRDFNAWLLSRLPPFNRTHMREFLRINNLHKPQDAVRWSLGLSLNDTFWVTEDLSLKWSAVNLYHNQFNEVIAQVAFTGDMVALDMPSVSPEFQTDGGLDKCWHRDADGVIRLKKRGTFGDHEPYAERMASVLLRELGYPYVPYTVEEFKGYVVSSCPLLTSERIAMTSFATFIGAKSVEDIHNYCKTNGMWGSYQKMLVADFIMMNTDRHSGNFFMLYNADTYKPYGLSPMLDHGSSFNLDLSGYQKPKLYSSFQSMAELCKGVNPAPIRRLLEFSDDTFMPAYIDIIRDRAKALLQYI